jgi:hypothetical protein
MTHQLTVSLMTILASCSFRDCLHQPGLFRAVLENVWDGNWTLVPLLINFAFEPAIRPFRRNQALDLLVAFFHNRRLRIVQEFGQNVEPTLVEIERLVSESSIQVSIVNLMPYIELVLDVGKCRVGKGNTCSEILSIYIRLQNIVISKISQNI